MKFLLLISLVFPALTLQRNLFRRADLKCVLTADKKVYKTGELPRFTVKIINDSKQDIYLPGSLDGSDLKWRFPHCYYTITGPGPDNSKMLRCGNMNPLRANDFRSVKAGQAFDPYERTDNYGFFPDHKTTIPETFQIPGEYRIFFNYSTNAQSISQFRGDFSHDNTDSLEINRMFKSVPKIDLRSNVIVIRVEER